MQTCSESINCIFQAYVPTLEACECFLKLCECNLKAYKYIWRTYQCIWNVNDYRYISSYNVKGTLKAAMAFHIYCITIS